MKKQLFIVVLLLACFSISHAHHKYYFEYTSPSCNIYKLYSDPSYTNLIGTIDPCNNNGKNCYEFDTVSRLSNIYIKCIKNGVTTYHPKFLQSNITSNEFIVEDGVIYYRWQPDVYVSNPPINTHIPYDNTEPFTANGGYTGDIIWKLYNWENESFEYTGDNDRYLNISMDSARKYIDDFDTYFRYGNEYPFRVTATVPGFTSTGSCYVYPAKNESGFSNTYYFDKAEMSVVNEDPEPTGEICDDEVTLKVEGTSVSSFDWYYSQELSDEEAWSIIRDNAGAQVNIGINELEIDSAVTTYFRAHKHGSIFPATENFGIVFYPPAPDFEITSKLSSCVDEDNGRIAITVQPHITKQRYQLVNDEMFYKIVDIPAYTNYYVFTGLPPSNSYKVEAFNIIGAENKSAPVCYSEETGVVIEKLKKPKISDPVISIPHCVGWDDGSVTISGSNMNAPLLETYLLKDGSIYKTSYSNQISDIPAGDYRIFCEDERMCNSDTTDEFHIDDPIPITFVTDSVLPLCYGSSDGEISILNAQGGVHSNYTFSIDPPTGILEGNTFSGLPSDNYQVKVALSDYTECYDTHTVVLPDPERLLLKDTACTLIEKMNSGYHITCAGGSDGAALLHASGGTGDFTYHLAGSPVGYSDTLTGLSARTYEGFVTDAHDCYSDTVTFIPLEPETIELSEIEYSKEKCRNTYDGGIDITVGGGLPPYRYFWTIPDEPQRITEDIYDISAGTYSVDITDDLGCEKSFPGLTLEPPDTIEAVISSLPPVCRGEYTGTIEIESILNGTTPYQYIINNESSQPVNELPATSNNRAPGIYSVTITDDNYIENDDFYGNCKSEFTVAVDEKDPVVLDASVSDPPCNGDNGSIQLTSVSGPGNTNNYLFNWYNDLNTQVGTTRNLNDQPAGDYHLLITDEESCDTSVFFTISEPMPLSFNIASVARASCVEVEDGVIEVQGAGGTSPYRYRLDGSGSFSSASVFSGLPAGEYIVNMQDNHLCLHDTTLTVDAGEVIVSVSEAGDVTCAGFNDGFITLLAAGGKGNYSYSADDGANYQGNATISDLFAGTYKVKVRDNETTCESDSLLQEITEPDPLVLIAELIDSAACGLPLGEIGYQAEGGSGDYELSWTYNHTVVSSLENLVTGDYEGTLRDMQSTEACTTSVSINVPDRPSPEITGHEVLTQTWCEKPLGVVTVDVTSGSPDYSFAWDDAYNQTTQTATDLTAGEYNVMVTDRYGCTDIYTFILEDGPPIIVSHTADDATCNQDNGNAYLSVYGGVKPYRFKWPDSLTVSPVYDSVMSHLYSGIYEVTVSDEIGCEQPHTVEISNLDGPEINGIVIHKSWCELEKGFAQVSADGGTIPYTWEWIPQGNSQSISFEAWAENLAAGVYYARVTDATGCIDIAPVTVTDSAELEPALVLVAYDSSSCGQATGRMEVLMSGGLEPYAYLWNTASENTNSLLTDIAEGTYRVAAVDSRGCIKEMELEMTDKALPMLAIYNIEDAYCSKPAGKIQLTGSRGDAPYIVVLDGNMSEPYSLEWADSLNIHYGTIEQLLPKTYHLVLYDSHGCTSQDAQVQVGNFSPMQMNILEVVPVSCYGDSDGKVTVEVTDGIEPYHYQWSTSDTDTSENGSLPAGDVQVTVADAEGCEISETIPVTQPNALMLSHSIISDPACHDMCNGSVEVTGTGGTGTKRYIWNDTDTTARITGLCAGLQQMVMTDENGCREAFSFTLLNPQALVGAGLPKEEIICQGLVYTINLEDTLQNAYWTSDNGFEKSGNTIELSEAGNYCLEAESAEGCPVTDTFTLYLSDDLLTADFLMASEAEAGEEVVLVEISWPVPDQISWTFPDEMTGSKGDDFVKEVVFEEAGTYEITLTASLGDCHSVASRTIEIIDVIPGKGNKSEDTSHKVIKALELYPNPADDNFYIDMELEQESEIRTEILGSNGQHYMNKPEGTYTGKVRINMNISDYKSGIYIVRVIAGGEVENRIVVVY